ncbi:MAG: RNA methyltransferase [Betaproteobacteria bacterium]|nr:RNA methyltransferase [Betaproteobacteria bacterium]
MKAISSRDNPLVKQVKRLRESGRARREAGLTLADGVHLIEAGLDAGVAFDSLLIAESVLEQTEIRSLLARIPQAIQYCVPDSLMNGLSPLETPTGILGLLPIPHISESPDPNQDWLVLDGVQDAGNVGTLLRTAAAAGVREALLGPGCAQVWSPKVLRAGMGAQFVLRLHEVDNLVPALAAYRSQVVVTRLDGATPLWQADLRKPIAWVFGSEGQGVSAAVAAQATLGIRIPMAQGIESLNVAAAAAICLFEQRRQRSL